MPTDTTPLLLEQRPVAEIPRDVAARVPPSSHLARRQLLRPVALLLAVILRVVLRLLKPIVQIRFGQLWSPRLGIFTLTTEMYLCERDVGIQPRHSIDLFYHYDRDGYMLQRRLTPRQAIANQQLNAMFERALRVWDGAALLDRLNRLLPAGSQEFIVPLPYAYDHRGLLERTPVHLQFTPAERARGHRELRRMGIEPEMPIACFHARDAAYLDRARPRDVQRYGDWSWHNLRDASIHQYAPMAERLAQEGYAVLRMGKYVKEPLASWHVRVIDYATRYQSDFMDVFLAAHCALFIGQNSGMTALSMVFRRPLAFVNIFPLAEIAYCQYLDSVFIPKLFYAERARRLLTFREILDYNLGAFSMKQPARQQMAVGSDLTVVENTPEEIDALVLEAQLRMRAACPYTTEDDQLQQRFLDIIRAYPQLNFLLGQHPRLRIGTQFLRSHRELLT